MRIGPHTVAVVTGAANGIGRSLVEHLASTGASVALIDVDAAGLDSMSRLFPRCTVHTCDVADSAAVNACAATIIAAHGSVHLLVNNAGISVSGSVEDLPLERFQQAMAINFWGVVHTCRAFLPHLRAAEAAAICNVLSDFALISLPTKAAYSASKHAARALTEALGAELYGTGITVTSAYVGRTATDLVRRGYAVDTVKKAREEQLMARGLTPAVVARKIVWGIERGRARIFVGADVRVIDLATRLAPSLVQAAMRRLWRRIPFL